MLYLGHFTFDPPAEDDEDEEDSRHGYFSVLAQAESVDEAFDKFRALIPSARVRRDVFAPGTQVWLDSCVEVRSLPPEGVIAHMVVALGEEGSLSASLVGAARGVGGAYGWGADDAERDDEASRGDDPEAEEHEDDDGGEPFLILD